MAVASSRTLEVLDLEGTGLTNQSAQVCNIINITTTRATSSAPQSVWKNISKDSEKKSDVVSL